VKPTSPLSSSTSATGPVLDAPAIERALRRIAHEIVERNPDTASLEFHRAASRSPGAWRKSSSR